MDERHRHRYEVNPEFVEQIEKAGLQFVGKRKNCRLRKQHFKPLNQGRDETGNRMEILELPNHPYFVATQYHPEYISRPLKPSAPYLGLVLAAAGKLQTYLNNTMSSNTTSEDGENSGNLRNNFSLEHVASF